MRAYIVLCTNDCEQEWRYYIFIVDDRREDALETGGLDLVIVPGLGFTKVNIRVENLYIVKLIFLLVGWPKVRTRKGTVMMMNE